MRASLIYPRVLNLGFPPLGVLYIASILQKHGHEVQVVQIDRWNKEEAVKTIKIFNPCIVGISLTNTTQLDLAGLIVGQIKPLLPEAFFVAGGTCATTMAEYLLEDFKFDCIIRGEGEKTVIELINTLEKEKDLNDIKGISYKANGKIIQNPPQEMISDLDSIPFPVREIIDFSRYLRPPGILRGFWLNRSTSMITSRGCPAQCIYCGSHLIFGRVLRRRSVTNVLLEIIDLVDRYRIDGLWFADDTFTLNKEWVMNFSKELRKEKTGIRWGCQARVNSVDLEMLKEMKEAGCVQVEFGVESGSEPVLRKMKKGTDLSSVENAFNLTKKAKIRSLATFMVGNPNETQKDIKLTEKLAEKIKADFTIFFFTTAYPGTELFDMAVENKWLKDLRFSQWFVRTPPALEINFNKSELMKIRSRLQNKFFLRNLLSTVDNPKFLFKLTVFIIKNLFSFFKAVAILIKTNNSDDFIFNFIELSYQK